MEEEHKSFNKDLAFFQIICISLVSFLFPLILIATIIDAICSYTSWKVVKRASDSWNGLMIWSLYRISSNSMSKGGEFPFLNGMRSLSAYWVLLGHTFSIPVFLNIADDETINITKELRKNYFWRPIENFTLPVDTFFFMSGLLLFHSTWKILKMNNGKINNLPLLLLRKYLRLSVGTVILLTFSTIQYLLLRSNLCFFGVILFFKEVCSHCLWTHLLFIQNYWSSEEMCGPHMWFIAVLFQYHILGIFIVHLIYRNRNLGMIIGTLLAIICPVITFLILNRHRREFENVEENERFELMKLEKCRKTVYNLPCDHYGPYWFGMVTGYLVNTYHSRVINKKFQWWAWILSIICLISVIFSCHLSNTTNFRFLYESLHRTMWGIGLMWVVYACAVGNGGILNKFLSWKPFIVLGNISYLFYILHPMIVLLDCCQHKENYPFQIPYWIFRSLRSTAISICIAFLCHVGIERPALKLEEVMLYPLERRRLSNK